MKDIGNVFIGETPEDWQVVKLKRILFEKKEKSTSENPIVLSLARSGIRVRDITTNEGQLAESYLNYNVVDKGDLLLNPMDLTSGANCNVSEVEGVISPAYFNLNALDRNNIYYFGYFFKTQYWNMALFANGRGVSFENRWTLNRETLMNYYIPFPSPEEQESIASFLDKKTSQIDEVIEKTKESIDKYKSYKKSLITETVTKGLNHNVKMKDSGIEWIGEISEDWEIVRLKQLFDFSSGLIITKSNLKNQGIPVINYGEIHSQYTFDLDVNRDKLNYVDKEYLNTNKTALVMKDNFVFCDTSEDIEGSGNCILVQEDNNEPIFAGSHTVAARLKLKQNPRYIRYMLMAEPVKKQIGSKVYGVKVYSITQSILKTIVGIIPPLKEQKEIASYLDKKTSQIDTIIENKEKLIKKLKVYKKSLIFEYVTGKKEVL